MNQRNTAVVLGILCLAFSAAGTASAASCFTDLSALTANYYSAFPTGVNGSGMVTLEGFSAALPSAYYHCYLYSGGTAPTLNDITSTFGTIVRVISLNGSGQMAASDGYCNPGASALYSGGTVTSANSIYLSDLGKRGAAAGCFRKRPTSRHLDGGNHFAAGEPAQT